MPTDKAIKPLLELISRKHHQELYWESVDRESNPFEDDVDSLLLLLACLLDVEINIGGDE